MYELAIALIVCSMSLTESVSVFAFFYLKSRELTKMKVANRPEQSCELSRTKWRIVQNESRELTKMSRIVLGANLSSRELSRHLFFTISLDYDGP